MSRLTRWGVVIATAATGIFAFLLARPVSSTTHVATSAGSDDQGGASAGVTPPSTAGSATAPSASKSKAKTPTTQQQLQAPAQQPQRSNRHTQTTSGGS